MKDNDKLKLKNQLCFPIYLCSKEIIRKYTPLLNCLIIFKINEIIF